jgi:hypothetical protein
MDIGSRHVLTRQIPFLHPKQENKKEIPIAWVTKVLVQLLHLLFASYLLPSNAITCEESVQRVQHLLPIQVYIRQNHNAIWIMVHLLHDQTTLIFTAQSWTSKEVQPLCKSKYKDTAARDTSAATHVHHSSRPEVAKSICLHPGYMCKDLLYS